MVVTDVQEGKKNKNRVNIYVDGEFGFACYLETALKNGIKRGVEITRQSIEEIKQEDGNKYALETAVKFVSTKLRTQTEIESKLWEKQLEQANIDSAIDKLTEYGYIDDGHYAELYAQELSQKYGRKMMLMKLAAKGIDNETAVKAVAESAASSDALKEQVGRLEQRYKEEEPQKRKQKIIRSLLQKGFGYDEIKSVLGGGHED